MQTRHGDNLDDLGDAVSPWFVVVMSAEPTGGKWKPHERYFFSVLRGLVDCPGDSWSIKSQPPSSKLQRTPNTQIPKPTLPIGAWALGVPWDLELGAWELTL